MMEDPNITEGKLAKITMQLLDRVEIKGSEVGAFVDVHNWLQAKVDYKPKVPQGKD